MAFYFNQSVSGLSHYQRSYRNRLRRYADVSNGLRPFALPLGECRFRIRERQIW